MRIRLALAVLALTVSASNSAAQDWTADPNFGQIRLSEGFTPDPHEKGLTAGGSIEIDMGECTYGYVSSAPDIDLSYSTSGRSDLYIYVESGEDVTLLINTADGDWLCNDDGLGGTDPVVVIRNASGGLYNIWVGTYGSETVRARLHISEIDPR